MQRLFMCIRYFLKYHHILAVSFTGYDNECFQYYLVLIYSFTFNLAGMYPLTVFTLLAFYCSGKIPMKIKKKKEEQVIVA